MERPRFAVLDVVEIAEEGGRRGVVAGIRRYDDGRHVYGLGVFGDDDEIGGLYGEESWVEEIGEVVLAAPGQLTATGERMPPAPRGRAARSTAVSTEGEVVGASSFVIVDEVDHYT